MTHPIPVADRFWPKVDRSGGPDACWIWRASLHNAGYGQIGIGRRPYMAHRVSYELLVGPIPEGLHLDHLCRVRSCVNPRHLEPVTCRENVHRGIGPSAQNVTKTHCPEGHPLFGANLWIETNKRGREKRHCRTCRRAAVREYQRRLKERVA